MIRHGFKTIETRTYNTNYRGEVLICAGANPFDQWDKIKPVNSYNEVFNEMLEREPGAIIYGQALALATLINCREMDHYEEKEALCRYAHIQYKAGQIKAWKLESVRPIEPIPIKGNVFLFDVPEKIIQKIKLVSL